MRSVVSPNSPTLTAWWPSGDQRTSTGESTWPWGAGQGEDAGSERDPGNQRLRFSTVCSRASSPKPFLWCMHPSPAAESSGACVWVRQVEDAEGRIEP